MQHRVGVIGVGFVGTAVSVGLETVLGDAVEIREYDKYKDTESIDSVVNNSDIVFICLPTPMNEDGSCDASIVMGGVREVAAYAKKRKTIVIKSTGPPGTTAFLRKEHPEHTILFNPEYLTEKSFIDDFIKQDRIIIGLDTTKPMQAQKLHELYTDFVAKQRNPKLTVIHECDSTVAEMAKYVANSFLATKVMFFNEVYEICKSAGISYEDTVGIACLDKRIGTSHTKVPGDKGLFGFGGSCFPKDINELIYFAKQHDLDPMVIETAWTKNLMIRQEYDWEKLAQVTGAYKKK
jgi:UDPglucose 6-dehydrogenase